MRLGSCDITMYPGFGGRVKFFDSKYRLFGVINIIDLVVIIALLAGGYAIYRVLAPKAAGGKGGAGTNATFTVVCPTTRFVTPDQIKVGDAIYKTTGQQIGTVASVEITPSPVETWDATTRKVVQFPSTIAQDVLISVATKGQPTSTGFAVGSVMIHSNVPMPVMTSTFDCDSAYLSQLKISGQ
jgi:hypothetical protein